MGHVHMLEISDTKSLAKWLKGRPMEDAYLIASRATLRALPGLLLLHCKNLTLQLEETAARWRAEKLLPCYRAAIIARVAGTWPEYRMMVRDSATTAAARLENPLAESSTGFAARAAAMTVDAAGADDAARRAAKAVGHADGALTFSTLSACHSPPGTEPFKVGLNRGRTIWRACEHEVALLKGGAQHDQLSLSPLWHDNWEAPDNWWDVWAELKQHLLEADEGWDYWISWYEGLIHGRQPDQLLELAIASLPDDVWKSGPKTVAVEIAKLTALQMNDPKQSPDHGPKPDTDASDN